VGRGRDVSTAVGYKASGKLKKQDARNLQYEEINNGAKQ